MAELVAEAHSAYGDDAIRQKALALAEEGLSVSNDSILARPCGTGALTPQKGASFQHVNPPELRTWQN